MMTLPLIIPLIAPANSSVSHTGGYYENRHLVRSWKIHSWRRGPSPWLDEVDEARRVVEHGGL